MKVVGSIAEWNGRRKNYGHTMLKLDNWVCRKREKCDTRECRAERVAGVHRLADWCMEAN